jgi:hypothetical protein
MSKPIVTQERLKELLSYDPETGVFTWKKSTSNRVKVGSEAGCFITVDGYKRIQIDGKTYLSHQLVFLYVSGEFPTKEIDHINRVRNDNRLSNLRFCNRSENSQNTKIRSNNTSGVKGVSWSRSHQKWHAYIKVNDIRTNCGYFESLDEASAARAQYAKLLHPFATAL